MSSIANNSDVHAFVSCEGLTDKMRADFNIMKDLASHTRLSPEQRESRINRLISNINKYRFYMSPIDVLFKFGVNIYYQLSHRLFFPLEMQTCRMN